MQIIDYLQCKGYKDTGLVFQPESGQQNAMNKQDLLEVNFVSYEHVILHRTMHVYIFILLSFQ